jgi:hypothetical protein
MSIFPLGANITKTENQTMTHQEEDATRLHIERIRIIMNRQESFLKPELSLQPFVDQKFPDELSPERRDLVVFAAHLRHFHVSGIVVHNADGTPAGRFTNFATFRAAFGAYWPEAGLRDICKEMVELNIFANALAGFDPMKAVALMSNLLRDKNLRGSVAALGNETLLHLSVRAKYKEIVSMLGDTASFGDNAVAICSALLIPSVVHVQYGESHSMYMCSRTIDGDDSSMELALVNFGDGSEHHHSYTEEINGLTYTYIVVKTKHVAITELRDYAAAVCDVGALYKLFPSAEMDKARIAAYEDHLDYGLRQVTGNCTTHSLLHAIKWSLRIGRIEYTTFVTELLLAVDVCFASKTDEEVASLLCPRRLPLCNDESLEN